MNSLKIVKDTLLAKTRTGLEWYMAASRDGVTSRSAPLSSFALEASDDEWAAESWLIAIGTPEVPHLILYFDAEDGEFTLVDYENDREYYFSDPSVAARELDGRVLFSCPVALEDA